MITGPLAWVLTGLFTLTAAYCGWRWFAPDAAAVPDGQRAGRAADGCHTLMSVAMVVMVWWPAGQLGLWAQAGVFTLLTGVLALLAGRTESLVARLGAVSHVVLNSAMVWMLAAMPWLMAASADGDGDGHTGHGDHGGHSHAGHGADVAAADVPGWMEVAHLGVLAATVLVGLWWLGRVVLGREHRLHHVCHTAMAAGMAAMLAVM